MGMRHVVFFLSSVQFFFKLKKIVGFRCVIDIGCSHYLLVVSAQSKGLGFRV